jgi:hypothetical protein
VASPEGAPARIRRIINETLEFATTFRNQYGNEPEPGSPADIERTANGLSGPSGPWGSNEVELAHSLAGGALLMVTANYLASLPPLLGDQMVLFGFQAVSRSVVETAARAWWLLEPGIGPRMRVTRALVEKLYSNNEMHLIDIAESRPESEHLDRMATIKERGEALGLEMRFDEAGIVSGFVGVKRKGSTTAVKQFMADIGFRHGEMWYRFLSAITHGTLYAATQYLTPVVSDDPSGPGLEVVLPLTALMNVGALSVSSYLGVIQRHAVLYGRDATSVERQRLAAVGTILG